MQGGAGVLRWALLLALASAGAEMADRKLGYISARREFEGFAVVFQVHLLRFPTVYNLAMDDVMDIPVNLRVENSTFADARVPTTFPRVTLFINGKPIGRMDTELYTWNNDWRGWESPGSFSIPMEATGMGPGWWKFGMAVDAPDLSGLALPSVDAHCAADCKGGSGAGQAGGVHLMVPWDVRIVKTDAAAPHVAAATAAATAPHRRSAAPLGRWAPGLFPLREGGQGVVNESMSRVAWDTVGARVARMCQGGEGGAAQGGERSGGLAFVMDALSPDSIVHLAAGSVPELDCEMRACHFGVVLELEADAALGTAGLFLQGVELHTHNCPRAADADDALFDAARAVEDTMWDWSADFPRVGETQVRAQGGVGLLLIDAHALGYHAVRAILERWSRPLLPLLHDRAGIVVRSSGACSAGERALRDFVRAEGGEWAVYRNLTGAGDDVVCDANREAVDDAGVGSMTLLLRDREATALAKDRQDPTGARCWGCAAQEMRTPGEKWDVPGVYLTIGGARDEAMQAKVAALGPKARLARYQGRDGRREALCQRLGGGKRSQAGTGRSHRCSRSRQKHTLGGR
ncbi:hypothetical protein T484DRAFT_3448218 [Baffinella frigidus]|nr:hypothetical protein T484DRAFT_3448218 [Cryptophyta sp. CCMP2293]